MPLASIPEHVDLGRGPSGAAFSLATVDPAQCTDLGRAFAAIDPWASYPYPAEALARYFATEEVGAPRRAILADGVTVGLIAVRLAWLRGPYVQFLGLLPRFQGLGAGGMALQWLAKAASTAGERNLWVCASDFNAKGIQFYERHGFARVAELNDLVQDGRTELLLRRRLSSAAQV